MNPFRFEKIDDFDAHIFSSIPMFKDLNHIAGEIASSFAQDDTAVFDLGCSTGRFLRQLPKRDRVRYFGFENKIKPIEAPDVEYICGDLADELPPFPFDASVIFSMFTLQFIPTHKREIVIEQIRRKLVAGGVFIVAEKTHLETPQIESVMQNSLHEWKRAKFSSDEILDKSASLKSVMHCKTQSELLSEASTIGEPCVVWSWGQFVCLAVQKRGRR